MEKKSSNYEICIGFLFGKEKQNKKWSVSCKKSYVRQKKKCNCLNDAKTV